MSTPERPDSTTITSTRSDRVRRIASLSGRSARARHGLFRVEGPQAVRSLLEHRPDLVHELFLTADAETGHPELVRLADAAGVITRTVADDVLRAMVRDHTADGGLVSPQGVVATAAPAATTVDHAVAALPAGDVTVLLLHELRDPGNVGTIIRTADAAGADLVILTTGSVDIHAPKVVRSSAGSLFHLPVATGADVDVTLDVLRAAGLGTVATSGYALHDLFAAELPARLAWILGNEAHGLRPELLERTDLAVRIPSLGRAESLNVATAATVCLFETLRRRGLQ